MGAESGNAQSVLVVEDERKIARIIELELNHEGYQVTVAYDGQTGLERALDNDFDLVLLDLMLPIIGGLEVCKRLRAVKSTPIIMLTARDRIGDKVAGLDAGADDYVTKPFETEELLARVRAAMRRNGNRSRIRYADVELLPDERRVLRAGIELELTAREFDLLHYLMKNADKVLNRDAILRQVWGYRFEGETNVVDVYIRYLRMKLDEPFAAPLIQTIRGVGYVFRA